MSMTMKLDPTAAIERSAEPCSVTIAPAAPGTWRVSTTDDSFGGLFTSRKAALAFAQAEERFHRHAS